MISHKAYFTAKQPEADGKSFLKDLEIIQPRLIGKNLPMVTFLLNGIAILLVRFTTLSK